MNFCFLEKLSALSHIGNLWNMRGALSDWTGIIGFFITIYLLYTTGSIKDKMQRMLKFKDFKKDKKSLINDLNSSINLIRSDPNDQHNTTELTKIIRKLQDYKMYMTKDDKKALKSVKTILSVGISNHNSNELMALLASLVGFLEQRQEFDINGL